MGIIVFGVVAGIYAFIRGHGSGRRGGLKRIGRMVSRKGKASRREDASRGKAATDGTDET